MAITKKKQSEVKFLSKIKRIGLDESYVSLILGLVVVVAIIVIIFSFGKNRQLRDTSSTQDGPIVQKEEAKSSQDQKMYVVKRGDDLWHIAEDVYKDGYKWVEIAKANKIENPGMIFSGNKLVLPEIKITATPTPSPTPPTEIKTNSVTGDSYKIVEGDNLWDISVRAYGDGYKWVELAKVNNLENPDLIYPNNTLNLPR